MQIEMVSMFTEKWRKWADAVRKGLPNITYETDGICGQQRSIH